MNQLLLAATTALLALTPVSGGSAALASTGKPAGLYDIKLTTIEGKPTSMAAYKGRVVLVVNTASRCGFTGQYEDLQKLHEKYNKRGLSILGFPSNDFMGQEPGDNKEIATACSRDYGVSFDMFDKAPVTGKGIQPLFAWLTESNPAHKGGVLWNFEKFVINRRGELVARYRSTTSPSDATVVQVLEKALQEFNKPQEQRFTPLRERSAPVRVPGK
jgi:glutathione peroxidase